MSRPTLFSRNYHEFSILMTVYRGERVAQPPYIRSKGNFFTPHLFLAPSWGLLCLCLTIFGDACEDCLIVTSDHGSWRVGHGKGTHYRIWQCLCSGQSPTVSRAPRFCHYITRRIVNLRGYFWSSLAAGISVTRIAKICVLEFSLELRNYFIVVLNHISPRPTTSVILL
jgi:hypothetical protein